MPTEILTPTEVAELRRLAEAVPPRPWRPLKAEGTYNLAEAAFLSKANPSTVLALLAEIDRLNGLLEEIRYDGMERLAPSENPYH